MPPTIDRLKQSRERHRDRRDRRRAQANHHEKLADKFDKLENLPGPR